MEVHFLGTTGYHPNDQRHTLCVMLPELGIVLDAGTAFFRVRDRIQTPEIKIFLSHAHLDHVIGLSFLFDVLHQKSATAHLYAQREKLAAIESHLFAETLFPVRPPFTSHPLSDRSVARPVGTASDRPPAAAALGSGGRLQLNCGTGLQWFPLVHPGGAIGFRLDLPGGRSLAYVTDTTASPDANYLPWIRGVDLLIHECYFDDGCEDLAQLTGHSCLSPVLGVARAVAARRVALVHLNPLGQAVPTPEKVAELAPDMDVFIPHDQDIIKL
jgi:ribonuclease BN (tRNA processing enzyme)